MSFPELAAAVLERKELSEPVAEALMGYLMDGQATPAQIGGILMALRVRGVTTRELAAFARALRERMTTVEHAYDDLVDTCGTGGGAPSFNLSTAAAFVASAAGVRVAKHGNRGVTSRCGSVDVLEALGVPVTENATQIQTCLDRHGLAFLFAPSHHPAMRHVGPSRKELGVRTVFNQLGPLANPARARRQLIGVYDPSIMRAMGEALNLLGAERALIAHGRDGLDEISPSGPTDVVRLQDGRVEWCVLEPSDFGMEPVPQAWLVPGECREDSAEILVEAITDADSPRAKAVRPNAAAAVWLAGLAPTLAEAAERAREAVASGAARRKLEESRA